MENEKKTKPVNEAKPVNKMSLWRRLESAWLTLMGKRNTYYIIVWTDSMCQSMDDVIACGPVGHFFETRQEAEEYRLWYTKNHPSYQMPYIGEVSMDISVSVSKYDYSSDIPKVRFVWPEDSDQSQQLAAYERTTQNKTKE